MSTIQSQVSLQPFHTFGMDVKAKWLAAFNTLSELAQCIKSPEFASGPHLVLGGGSNVLFREDFPGMVLLNRIKGVRCVSEDEQAYYVEVGAGESWHEFVLKSIEEGWFGFENLSLIPGSVGAAPMQNIGAYGVELKDRFHSLKALHIASGALHSFDKQACEFGYRESVFKRRFRDQYIIVEVSFRLLKEPEFRTDYGDITAQLERSGIRELSAKAISDAIIAIRQSKLPDPKLLGNAGSFFKNPEVEQELALAIQAQYPNLSFYPLENGRVKLAAAWLIDQAGWKGKTFGRYGVHKNQALVLVNYGAATGREIFDLSEKIMADIQSKFGVQLEREVNIY